MKIKVPNDTMEKIRIAKNGNILAEQLDTLISRDNTDYQRGALHGFLLALTRLDIITGNEAIAVMEQAFDEAHNKIKK